MDSSTNFHLESWITIRSPLAAPPPFARDAIELLLVGLGLFPLPLGASTKLLGSSIERPTDPEWARAGAVFEWGGGGGGPDAGDRGEGAPGGGGGGGAEVGELAPVAAARMAACTAILGETAPAAGGGGGGGCDLAGAGGGRGADEGGGGGGAGGSNGAADDGGGGAGALGRAGADNMLEDGLRELGGGGGFFPIGGGGPFSEADDMGRAPSWAAVLLRFAIDAWLARPGIPGRPGTAGAAPAGGRGAEAVGGFGADDLDDSGSDRYDEAWSATICQMPIVESHQWPARTSSVHSSAGLSEFRHASGEETSQLRGSIHRRGGRISAPLVAVAPRSVAGHRRSETPGGFRETGDGWSTSYR